MHFRPLARSATIAVAGFGFALSAIADHHESMEMKRADDEYNLGRGGLAIDGYDPVSYFPEGGGEPEKGDRDITSTVGEVTYRFASEANKAKFDANPAKYEPAYGGWCAYALGDSGEKVSINPKAYRIHDGRLYLFYKTFITDTTKSWDKDTENLRANADKNWEKVSGESAERLHPSTEDES